MHLTGVVTIKLKQLYLFTLFFQNEWPQRITSELVIGFAKEREEFGTQEAILRELTDATRIL